MSGGNRRPLPGVIRANSLWGQQGYVFAAPFLDALARYYGAG